MTIAAPADPFGDLFETIDQMTVVELVGFIKTFEDRFGVSAQPVVGPAVEGPPVEEAPVEEQTEFEAYLAEVGQAKIQVIKTVRELTQLGLKESKDLVDSAPVAIKTGIDRAEAEKIKAALDAVGALVEIR